MASPSPTQQSHQDMNISIEENTRETKAKPKEYTLLLTITYISLFVGSVASTLISKFYFIHNGSSKWILTWVQSAGFPILVLPVYLPFYMKFTTRKPFSGFTSKFTGLSVLVGLFLGVSNFLFSWGLAYLPVSTGSLILSSQLAFNLILSVLIVNQKITFNNMNSVVLLTLSSVLLALASSNDRPPGISHGLYLVGFFATLGAGLSFALYLPVMEMIYRQVYCFAMVVEMQLIMEIAATVFATIGMAIEGSFGDFKRESRNFDKGGSVGYWLTITANLVTWQFSFMGTAGLVFLTTSLTGGICMTALMAANVMGGVVVYGDHFGGVKVVSTVLCVWGFCSYVYGIYRKSEKQSNVQSMEMEILVHPS